ncbi:MAG: response regulator [Verrucomicrobia bacterium]|nr:response regulator [Verrucomicrobiota bacterium]MBI3867864.1 response regulator [Verrucomicrobiota bacterium]
MPEHPTPQTLPPTVSLGDHLPSLRVLHLEDDPQDVALCERELNRAGWEVLTDAVSSREDFAAKLAIGRYDVILMDYQLRGWVGLDALDTLRNQRKDIPAVLVTGSIGEENVAEALRRGFADYVLKNRLGRLPHVVRRVLADRSERAEKRRLAEERDCFFMLSGDLLCIVGVDGLVAQLNPAWHRTLGFDLDALVQRPLADWAHPDDRPKFLDALSRLSKGAATLEWETRCPAADGSVRWLQWKGSSAPRRSLIYATARDVTEKKALEAQLLRTQRVESIGALANGIAHDLNNVLTPILMAADILLESAEAPRSRKLLTTIQASAHHGAAMVKQILCFSKGAEGEKAPLHLKHLIGQIRDFVRDTFPASIRLRAQVSDDAWLVSGDSTQLHQVLLNLCINARDAMPSGGQLGLELSNLVLDEAYCRLHIDARPGPYLLLTVSDTGVGIPAELLEKIFEPFFTTKEQGKGTGLGLSTVVGIVRAHGGFLNVYSEPGRGTRFNLYFPASSEAAERRPIPAQRPRRSGQGECILVVDDEESFRDITRAILEQNNYRVLTASEGAEALAIVARRQGQVDLAITDMMMPVLDGTATLRSLHRLDPALRLMATSGMPLTEPLRSPGESRPIPFLLKPYDTTQLLAAVRDVLERPPVRAVSM